MIEICKRCRFYNALDARQRGECLRYPPPFPETKPGYWCGEYQPIEREDLHRPKRKLIDREKRVLQKAEK